MKSEEIVDEKDSDLCKACMKGELDAVTNLLGGFELSDKDFNSIASSVRHKQKLERTNSVRGNKISRKSTLVTEINRPNSMGSTPLHIAAERGFLEIVSILVDKKALINQRDNNGKTPLYVSIEKEQFKVTKFLIEAGADPNVKDQFNNTALHQASILQKNLFLILLLSANGNINIQNVNGWTCLHVACFYNRHKIVNKMLSYKKTPIDVPDREFFLPIHIAAARGSTECVDLLIKRGSELNARSIRGETPLLLASKNDNIEAMSLLLLHKADPNIKDNKENLPNTEKLKKAELFRRNSELCLTNYPENTNFLLSKLSLFAVEKTTSTFLIVTQPLVTSLGFEIVLNGKERDSKDFSQKGFCIDLGDGTYFGSFLCPPNCDVFQISVTCQGKHVNGSPCEIQVVKSKLTAKQCFATGAGIYHPSGTAPNKLTVYSRNQFGGVIDTGGETFEITFLPPLDLPPKFKDNGDGSYAVEYLLFGKYNSSLDIQNLQKESSNYSSHSLLNIKHKGTHIFGSPYSLEIFSVNTKLLEMEGVRKLSEDIYDIQKEIEKIENGKDDRLEDTICKGCTTQKADSVIFPCAHFYYCHDCSKKFFSQASNCSCGKKIQGYTKIKYN
eukprot:TRINITY_DN1302_c0_g1_i1.p1 TRINITY_DN1302_c0_g1~~TRINITY_DN1302_c0_g1_i1.p1  ORF type:complete len:615 (-),score=148.57 TRINITY_DN1302_c0_g1_i1:42-1886(-)